MVGSWLTVREASYIREWVSLPTMHFATKTYNLKDRDLISAYGNGGRGVYGKREGWCCDKKCLTNITHNRDEGLAN